MPTLRENLYNTIHETPIETRPSMAQSYKEGMYLQNVSIHSSGTYTCEVSEEFPSFRTKSVSNKLEVFVIPDRKPFVYSAKRQYQIGERAVLNCTSPPSYPATELYWYVNGEKVADEENFRRYKRKIRSRKMKKGNNRLKKVTTNLEFIITPQHFDPSGRLQVSCHAEIENFYNQTATLSIVRENSRDLTVNGKIKEIVLHL
ncbi:Junctional adhesion molecule A [Nymphon striatum]|nr:Junctional adhesion molecule A [Nymphon striatum]